MSSTELYAVNNKGDVVLYDRVKNSWLGAMHVWNSLNDKYFLGDSLFEGFNKTWGYFGKVFYETYEDIILGSTFDYVLVRKDEFDRLIESFQKYFEENRDSNFGKQIEILKQMKEDENVVAVGWCQTSVSNEHWNGPYDEDKDEFEPYNINKGDKHWFLFEDLEDAE